MAEDSKANPPLDTAAAKRSGSGSQDGAMQDESQSELQHGVRDMRAITATWPKWSLIALFCNIWLLYFINAFQSAALGNLIPYVTSDWESHSLLSVIYVVSDAITAACYILLGKVMDLWGRAEGFLFMTICTTVGLMMMAAGNNLPLFCAAYVFHTLGFSGMTYCVDVLTANASVLKSRALAYVFTSSPYIITAFAGSGVADDILGGIGIPWGFGVFCIIFPLVAAPLYILLKWNIRKAIKDGHAVREPSGRTAPQSIWFYVIEFDGVFLFSAGLVLFFLAFDISSSAPNSWGTPYIIVMLVVGFCLLSVFIVYEKWVAPKRLFDFGFMWSRTPLGACLLDATYQLCYYCWNYYFTSFLQVVNYLIVAEAGYVSHTFDVVSSVLLLIGLMIYFRRPDQPVGYLVKCQVFISIGGSVFIVCEQLAILAAVDHQHFASTLGLLNFVGAVGDAMGATISGVIRQNTFPNALRKNLPESDMSDFDEICEDLSTQLSYLVGSATRIAIQDSCASAQTRILAVGTAIMVLSFVWTVMIKEINVKKVPQVKGMVF